MASIKASKPPFPEPEATWTVPWTSTRTLTVASCAIFYFSKSVEVVGISFFTLSVGNIGRSFKKNQYYQKNNWGCRMVFDSVNQLSLTHSGSSRPTRDKLAL